MALTTGPLHGRCRPLRPGVSSPPGRAGPLSAAGPRRREATGSPARGSHLQPNGTTDDAEHEAEAESNEARPDPRLPGSDEDTGRAADAEPSAPEGADQALGEPRAARQEAPEVDGDPGREGPAGRRRDRVPVTAEDPGERFPRQARLRGGADIRRVLRRGRRRRTGPVDVFMASSPAGRPRLGVVVPRHGHTIVERNRVRRRLQEIARRSWLPGAWEEGRPVDLVLRARPAAYGADHGELRRVVIGAIDELCSGESS